MPSAAQHYISQWGKALRVYPLPSLLDVDCKYCHGWAHLPNEHISLSNLRHGKAVIGQFLLAVAESGAAPRQTAQKSEPNPKTRPTNRASCSSCEGDLGRKFYPLHPFLLFNQAHPTLDQHDRHAILKRRV